MTLSERRVGKEPAPLSGVVSYEQADHLTPYGEYTLGNIIVGNSGLMVRIYRPEGEDGYVWEQHYVPEGYRSEPNIDKRRKFGKVYPYALHQLLIWWDKPDNFANLPPKPTIIQGETNFRMAQYLQELLGSDIIAVSDATHGQYQCDMDIAKLSQSAEVRAKLQSLSESCGQMGFTMSDMRPFTQDLM